MGILRGGLGIIVLIGIAYLFSSNRKAIDWRLVGLGILLQLAFGILITQVAFVEAMFQQISEIFVRFLGFSDAGITFLFGDLPNNSKLFVFALKVLPIIIFFSAVTSALYYFGVLQLVVRAIAWTFAKIMRLSGAESTSAAGNIFLGQTEAPLLVKPFIANMTKSELMCLMTGGMATIAGSILGGIVTLLGQGDPVVEAEFARHLLSASIMNAPAAIVMSKILVPELEPDKIDRSLKVNKEKLGVNFIDALSIGTTDGLKLAVNVGAMLLVFIAVIEGLNVCLGGLGGLLGLNDFIATGTDGQFQQLSLEYILGQLFRIIAFTIGIEWQDALQVGSLLGKKTVVNEFMAYLDLSAMQANNSLQEKSILISTYALCGFSNFSSIAIQIGGISAMAPNQRGNLAQLGLKALVAATLACLMTATIAGMIIV